MAKNNALAAPTAAALRARAEGRPADTYTDTTQPQAASRAVDTALPDATADAFGAGDGSVVGAAAVASRGVGTAVRTPLDEFEARPRDEVRCVWTAVMFLTRLPCPGWCDHHPGYLMRSLAYFPLLGALIGVWAASIYDAAASLWSPLIASAISSGGTLWLTGCFHEDGLCDTLDGFGGGWTKAQILKIMKDSRNGSYATMGGCLWILAKTAAIARLGDVSAEGPSVYALGGSVGAGPAMIVAQGLARASSAPLIYAYEYIVDNEDAKGEYYNWFGESRRLLGLWRVAFSAASAVMIALVMLPAEKAVQALIATAVCTAIAGEYGKSVLGGVMGDFLGAAVCMIELAVYLAIGLDPERASLPHVARLITVVTLPQIYGRFARRASGRAKEC